MRRAPVRAVAVDETTTGQKLQDVMARLENLALELFPTAHDVAHPLLGFGRNADGCELIGAIERRPLTRVALVVLALHPRSFRNERRCDHIAGVAPLVRAR